jgi:hypothetical protein
VEFLTPFKMTKGKVRTFESFLCLLRWARRSLCPESTSRRRLFEQSEFLSHLRVRARTTSPVWMSVHPVWRRCSSFPYEEYAQSSRLASQASHHPNRGSCSCANPDSGWKQRHPGEPVSEQARRGTAHGQKWFWFLLPKQKGLVARGRNPSIINSLGQDQQKQEMGREGENLDSRLLMRE